MIHGLLLGAGRSRRFGAHKLLAPLSEGVPLGLAAARSLAKAAPVTAIVDPADERWAALLRAEGIATAPCPSAWQGMGASLAWGVALRANAEGWVVMLADMPALRPETITHVIASLRAGAPIAAPVYAGRRGHPVGFARELVAELLALHGDSGARTLIEAHAARAAFLPSDDPGVVVDIDTPGDLRELADGVPHR